jgi:rhamnogalacturonan endolyase
VTGGVFVSWRMFGYEYSTTDSSVSYNVYRDGTEVANVTDSTNYLDSSGTTASSYAISAVIGGTECDKSAGVTPWAQQYINIPLTPPEGGTTPSGDYNYNTATSTKLSGSINDGSPGDVDGDGEYEIVTIWEPSNAQDNSKSGYTGPVYLDCYKLSGKRLWRLNLGPNIRAGAHYTQFLVYDFDGDGKAEVALKTAPGTKDGTGAYLSKGPAASDDDSKDYRNSDGYVLSGPEYLTVFSGETGAELATVNFEVARGTVSSWGDSYGNRVDRFLASVGFVSDTGTAGKGSGRPVLLMGRGYYERSSMTAWTYRDGTLTKIWTIDSNDGATALKGQGAHSMAVADVDGDDAQEIIYGAAMIQSNGAFGCSTGFGHGDALHVGDFVPSRAGLEVFMPHEDTSKPCWDLRDAATCESIYKGAVTGDDNGRGVADDVLASNDGAELWSAADGLYSATTGKSIGNKLSSTNFLVWWDGDESRDLEDGTTITNGSGTRLLSCDNCMSNNTTKATPTLSADILGDWREEVIWRAPDSSALRVYTTTAVTKRRIYTLMHDPQYRMQVTSEMTAYNQPPHPSFHIGNGMAAPPVPNIHVK